MSEQVESPATAWLVVRPGDTLILRVSSAIRPEHVQALAASLKERLAGIDVAVVGGVDQMAVYRPEGG